ncbi:hypothetical protein Tco_0693870 [Tanacetum coccineum]
MEMEQRKTNQFQDTSKAESSLSSSCAMIVALDEPQHVFGSDITRKNIVDTTYSTDEVALKSSSIGLLDVAVNNNGLQQVSDLLLAPPQDDVAQESPSVLDDLAEIKQGLQQCFDLLHQHVPRQEVAQNIVETRKESSTREGDTRTKLLKKLDDVSASMPLLAGEFDGSVDKVDELLRDRVSKFQVEVQCSLKVINDKVQVDARTDKQDDEFKNHESCAIVLDQNKSSNMITNQMHKDIKNIVLSSSSVAKPCIVNNQNLEVEGASSRLTLEEGASNKQGPPQDDADIIGPESSIDQDHDMRHHDREEPPQEETKEDDPSQENVETPDSKSHSSKIMQEEVSDKQGPPQDADEVKDPITPSEFFKTKFSLQFRCSPDIEVQEPKKLSSVRMAMPH